MHKINVTATTKEVKQYNTASGDFNYDFKFRVEGDPGMEVHKFLSGVREVRLTIEKG